MIDKKALTTRKCMRNENTPELMSVQTMMSSLKVNELGNRNGSSRTSLSPIEMVKIMEEPLGVSEIDIESGQLAGWTGLDWSSEWSFQNTNDF